MHNENRMRWAPPGGERAAAKAPRGLAVILQAAAEIEFESDVSALLSLLADDATRVLEAERASIFFLEEETGELVSLVASDVSSTIRFPASQGIAGAVARTGEAVRVGDAYFDHRFYDGVDGWTGFVTKSVLAEPLQGTHQKTIGVFEVLNRKAGAFTGKDQNKLKLRARLASSIIETARLIRWLKRFGALGKEEPDFDAQPPVPLEEAVAGLERRLIQAALTKLAGNQSGAAKVLGITRQGLANKMRRYHIRPNRGTSRPNLSRQSARIQRVR